MECKIQTGYIANGSVDGRIGPSGPVLSSPGKTVLFSPDTKQGTIFSPTFTVWPGDFILIDAYNMPANKYIYLNRVIRAAVGVTVGDNCNSIAMSNAYGEEGKIAFRERMTLGDSNLWNLYRGQSVDVSVLQLLIGIPGTYELELEDTEMLGDLEVEYLRWEFIRTPYLPPAYFAGIYNVGVM